MVSKSSAVRSIRLPNEEWEWLIEEAARRDVTVNGLVYDLMIVGRLRAEEARAKPVNPRAGQLSVEQVGSFTRIAYAEPRQDAVRVSVPTLERKAFNPQPKTGKKR